VPTRRSLSHDEVERQGIVDTHHRERVDHAAILHPQYRGVKRHGFLLIPHRDDRVIEDN
jgi:hypothetical protein